MKVRLLGCFFFYWNSVYRELVSLWQAPATVRGLSSIEGRGHGFLCLFSLSDSVPSQVLHTVSFPPLLHRTRHLLCLSAWVLGENWKMGLSERRTNLFVFSASHSAGSWKKERKKKKKRELDLRLSEHRTLAPVLRHGG